MQPMQPIRDYVGYELEWVKQHWLRREFALWVNGDQAGEAGAEMGWLAMKGGAKAEGMIAEGNFSFRRQGFWKPTLLVTQTETQMPIATLSRIGNGGTLDFADGQTQQYTWKKAHLLSSEYLWIDSAGQTVMHVYPSNWKSSVKITFEPVASKMPDVGLLTLLGGFLAILAIEESAATTTVATTTVINS